MPRRRARGLVARRNEVVVVVFGTDAVRYGGDFIWICCFGDLVCFVAVLASRQL